MEPKTIIAIVLVAFIIGGFIFLQVKTERNNLFGAECEASPHFDSGGIFYGTDKHSGTQSS